MRAVADAVAQRFTEHPVVVARPCEEREPVVDHGQRLVGAAFVDPVIPVRRLIAVLVGPRIGLYVTVLRVAPVGQLVVEDDVLLGWELVQDLLEIAIERTEAGIAEQVHAVVLAVARLPAHGVGTRTIPKRAQPGARLLLQVLEDGDVAFVVEFLIGDEDLRSRMPAMEDVRHVLAQADEGAAVGLAAVALAASAVAASEADVVDEGRVAEGVRELLEQRLARRGNRRAQIALPADGLVPLPLGRSGTDVGTVMHQRLQAQRPDVVEHLPVAGRHAGLHGIEPGQRVIFDHAPGFFDRPASHLTFLEGHAALAILRAAHLESGRGAKFEREGKVHARRAHFGAAQDLAHGIEHAATVHARGHQQRPFADARRSSA